MKRVLVAVDNKQLFDNIKMIKELDVYNVDIGYKEGVIEYLANNQVDFLITKDCLDGDMTKEIYIKQIKLAAEKTRLILFVEHLEDNYNDFLFANGVYKIIEGNRIAIGEIKGELFDGEKTVYVNNSNVNETQIREQIEAYYANKNRIDVISKKCIAVFGTSGSGKSYISSVLANMISKKIKLNTLLVDFDLQNPAIDIYNNVNCYNNLLGNIIEDIDNNVFDENALIKNIYTNPKNSKLSYITNNIFINDSENKIGYKHYNALHETVKTKFDTIVYDNAGSIFFDSVHYSIDKADSIFFVINPNYISIRQAIKYLDIIINILGISKNRIIIVLNKIKKESLTKEQVNGLLLTYNLSVEIEVLNDSNIENIINGIGYINENNIKGEEVLYRALGVEPENKKRTSNGTCKKMCQRLGVKS